MLIALMEEEYFDLKIIRKKNKCAYLRVKSNRIIEVSVPEKMPYVAIWELVHRKKQWILEVSESLGEAESKAGTELIPIGKEEEKALKLKVEERAFDALERIYPLIKPYGIILPEIHVRRMSTKWGSCVVDKRRIWLNIYLIKVPEVCMDYILLWYLLQFHFTKQDAAFYKALTKAMPEWKEQQTFLQNIKLPQKKIVASSPKLY